MCIAKVCSVFGPLEKFERVCTLKDTRVLVVRRIISTVICFFHNIYDFNFFHLFQANQADSSCGITFVLFQKPITCLLGTGMITESFISDNQTSIEKWLRKECQKNALTLANLWLDSFFTFGILEKSRSSTFAQEKSPQYHNSS